MSETTETSGEKFGATVSRLAGEMMKLDTGALARLRRMDVYGPGELEFWKLATRFDLRTDATGIRFVRILALLAPKGEMGHRVPFHNFKYSLGQALADSGFSEARLARFMALPFERRGDALESIARFLLSSGATQKGVDCADIGRLLFFDDARPVRRLAATYYDTFDRLTADQPKENSQ